MEKINYPNIQNNKEELKNQRVLKISEMALSLDGEYLGEVGNPSYGEKADMFEYEPDVGLLIKGTKKEETMGKEDLVRIPHDLGHITIDRLLNKKRGIYSGKEFQSKISEVYRDIGKKIDKLTYLIGVAGLEFDQYGVDRAIKSIVEKNKNFSPEDLLVEIEDKIIEESGSPKIREVIDDIKNSDVLDNTGDSIIHYFYLFCRIKGVGTGEGIRGFRFVDELMDEYKRKPDGRFGDELLLACSELEKEWEADK